jgi:hypothetical protein
MSMTSAYAEFLFIGCGKFGAADARVNDVNCTLSR